MSEHYVYVIFRPTGEPCYVGKGKGDRWKTHALHSHNNHLRNLYNKHGGDLPVAIIRDGLTDEDAMKTEIALIAAIGRSDLKAGPLFNLSDGGEGPSGAIRSSQYRERVGAFFRGRKLPPEQLAARSLAMRGHKVSQETIEKIRRAHTGKKLSPEQVEGIKRRLTGVKHSVEVIEKRRVSLCGKKRSHECRERLSKIKKKNDSEKRILEAGPLLPFFSSLYCY